MFDRAIQINPNDAAAYTNKGKDFIILFIIQDMHYVSYINIMMQLLCLIVLFKLIQMMLQHI